jgi:DNA-binding cell septation regulator SpoVG
LALGVWSHGLAGHTGIDRIRRDLIAERINWALGIAQIVIPMHFLVKILQTGKGLYVGMPSKPDKSSKTGYRDTAKPITGEFRKQLHGAILTAYSAEIGRLQAVAAAQERPSIKDQLEAGAKEAAKEKTARSPKEKPAKGAER